MSEGATKTPDMSLVKPAWIVLIVGWVIMLLPIPFTGWMGWLIAGVVGIGIAQLLCALIVTPIVYWIGLAIFGASIVSAIGAAG